MQSLSQVIGPRVVCHAGDAVVRPIDARHLAFLDHVDAEGRARAGIAPGHRVVARGAAARLPEPAEHRVARPLDVDDRAELLHPVGGDQLRLDPLQAVGLRGALPAAQLVLGLGQHQHAARAEHDVEVELLAERPRRASAISRRSPPRVLQIVRADDRGVAAGVAAAEPALLEDRHVGDAVLLRQVIGGRQPVPAAAHDHHVVMRFGSGECPRRAPSPDGSAARCAGDGEGGIASSRGSPDQLFASGPYQPDRGGYIRALTGRDICAADEATLRAPGMPPGRPLRPRPLLPAALRGAEVHYLQLRATSAVRAASCRRWLFPASRSPSSSRPRGAPAARAPLREPTARLRTRKVLSRPAARGRARPCARRHRRGRGRGARAEISRRLIAADAPGPWRAHGVPAPHRRALTRVWPFWGSGCSGRAGGCSISPMGSPGCPTCRSPARTPPPMAARAPPQDAGRGGGAVPLPACRDTQEPVGGLQAR